MPSRSVKYWKAVKGGLEPHSTCARERDELMARRQEGFCPACGFVVTPEQKWEGHGKDLRLICPRCHKKVRMPREAMVGRRFVIVTKHGDEYCYCVKWTDEKRVFLSGNGPSIVDLDWMEYEDQKALGRIVLVED